MRLRAPFASEATSPAWLSLGVRPTTPDEYAGRCVPVSLNGEEVKARDGDDGGMEGRGVGVHACIWERKAVPAGWAVLRMSGVAGFHPWVKGMGVVESLGGMASGFRAMENRGCLPGGLEVARKRGGRRWTCKG
jgi:hypothetical protein